MPFGNDDWLALTQEEPLEPAIPLCDPHHHFWDRRLQSIPYQRYLLHELMGDLDSGHNVRSTVFLEARSMYRASGPEELKPVGEVEFVQGLAAASASGVYGEARAAAAIIGAADLKLGDDVARVLEALQAASPNRFRGIRHNVTWSPDPEIDNRESPGIMANESFRAGARVLARMGLSLDVMLAFPQLNETGRLRPRRPRGLHHPQPPRRCQPHRHLRRQGRRAHPGLAGGHRGRGPVPQRHLQAGRHGHAPLGIRLAVPDHPHRLRGAGRGDGAVDELRHRAVRAGPLHVREQLPARQGLLLLQRDVQRLQAPFCRP